MNRFLLFVFIITIVSCRQGDTYQLKEYYFPVETLRDGKIYQYNAVNDSIAPNFWFYKTVDTDSLTYLTATSYDVRGYQTQLIIEEIVDNGTLVNSVRLFEYDDSGIAHPTEATILRGNTFPFSVKDSAEVYIYKIEWIWAMDANSKNVLTKNRIFQGFKEYDYKGKTYECAEFKVLERYRNDHRIDGMWEGNFNSTELYAKGVGLIYKKTENGDMVSEIELGDIFTMDEFESKFSE